MLSAKFVIFALAVAFAVGNLWVTLARSTIPMELDGTVSDIELRFEKERGVDDVYLISIDDRVIHVDRAVGWQIARGDHLHKAAWSRTLETPRGPVRLTPSRDFRRMILVMPVVVLACFALLLRRPSVL